MARTFEFAMRSAIRANCGSDVTKLQHATKAPLLHMFDIHTNCEESFCSVRRRRLETVRMYLIFRFESYIFITTNMFEYRDYNSRENSNNAV